MLNLQEILLLQYKTDVIELKIHLKYVLQNLIFIIATVAITIIFKYYDYHYYLLSYFHFNQYHLLFIIVELKLLNQVITDHSTFRILINNCDYFHQAHNYLIPSPEFQLNIASIKYYFNFKEIFQYYLLILILQEDLFLFLLAIINHHLLFQKALSCKLFITFKFIIMIMSYFEVRR